MKVNVYPGKFIVFEGLNGSGKTTQAKLLQEYLEKKGQLVIYTKEPTDSNIDGQRAQDVLSHKIQVAARELQILMVRDRVFHLDNQIIPSLKKGVFVVCDRYILSTIAFGGLDLSQIWLIQLNEHFIWPNFTFIIDTAVDVCLKRLKQSCDSLKFFEKKQLMEKVRQNYLDLAKSLDNVYVIDGNLPILEIFEQIKNILGLK